MLYKITNGTVELSGKEILDGIDFEIRDKNNKIAVVGRNGSGKTTLLKLIAGDYELTLRDKKGGISKTGNPDIGYLRQITFEDENLTLDEEIRKVFVKVINMKERLDRLVLLMNEEDADHEALSKEYVDLEEKFKDENGYYYEKEYDTILRSFGFSMEDKVKKLSEFSGGQRTKLAFIKLLLSKPDILLLDEPTNHLDIEAIEWLEGYLRDYKKAVVIVSHDRMFLDNVVDTVYEIERSHMKRYPGNYTYFINQKKEAEELQKKAYNAQQKEIARLSATAERFMAKATKTSMAQNKIKQIERMEKVEAVTGSDDEAFHADFVPNKETGKDVLFVNDLSVGYDSVLSNVSFDIKKGNRLAVIGKNGVGKSTLLKTLVNAIPALSGEYKYGANVEIGYFDQKMAEYTSDKQVIDDFWDEFPNLTETNVRNSLGAFLFTQDDVFKTVKMLSGGERVRLALAKIFKRKPNVLILDEPTNHMDIIGKEALEDMLLEYKGTVIFVSHDRYFVKKVSNIILSMDENESVLYPFGYEYYIEKVREQKVEKETSQVTVAKTSEVTEKESAGKASYLENKELSKLRKKADKLMEEISALEEEVGELKEKLNDEAISSDYMKLRSIQEEIDSKEEVIMEKMSEWEEICETI